MCDPSETMTLCSYMGCMSVKLVFPISISLTSFRQREEGHIAGLAKVRFIPESWGTGCSSEPQGEEWKLE